MPYDLPVTQQDTSTVIELRQYTMQPGKRDKLVELFDRHFIRGQEEAGMRVLGQFRDRADPDRFVWLRGFRDMPSRGKALEGFYGGPMWREYRNEANATIVDAGDVLLLRPVDANAGFTLPSQRIGVGTRLTSLVVATIYLLQAPVDASFLRFFDMRVAPAMVEAGATPIARFQTEYAPNNFPKLSVREGEHAFVWFSAFASAEDYDRYLARLWDSGRWNGGVKAELTSRLKSPAQQLVLQPTALSLVGNADSPAGVFEAPITGDVHDFDFLPGDWIIKNRRLKQRGVGSNDWDEFPATSRASIHLGGIVNTDENDFPTKGWSGMTIRTFDTAKKQWSIYWVNSRLGTMLPPVVGGFKGDHGVFVGDDDDEGRPIKVIFNWTKLGPDRAHWQQSFSYDGGKTWEVNWTMELARKR